MNKEIIGMSIAEYLIKEKGYRPLQVSGGEMKGMFLENIMASKYQVIFISLKDSIPEKQITTRLAATISKEFKKQAALLTAKIGIISFGNTILKVEYKESDVFVCTNDIHADLYKVFPKIKNLLRQDVSKISIKDKQESIQKTVLLDVANQTTQMTKIITSSSYTSYIVIISSIVIPMLVYTFFVETRLVELGITSLTIFEQLIIQGASYAPITFGEGQWWRLISGFLVNDIFTIFLIMLFMKKTMIVVESVFGLTRTILAFFLTGILITYIGTIVSINNPYYGATPILFTYLGMLTYYSYYNRILYKAYIKPVIMMFAVLGIVLIILNPTSAIYISLSSLIGYLLAAVMGFKNSKTTSEIIFPVTAIMMFVGALIYIQSQLNWEYYDISRVIGYIKKIYS